MLAVLLALATTIRSAADLAVATFDRSAVGTPFEFDATLLSNAKSVAKDTFSVGDSSGAMILRQEGAFQATNSVPRGTKVRVSGIIAVGKKSQVPYALCRDLSILEPGTAPDIPTITGKGFAKEDPDEMMKHLGIASSASANEPRTSTATCQSKASPDTAPR